MGRLLRLHVCQGMVRGPKWDSSQDGATRHWFIEQQGYR